MARTRADRILKPIAAAAVTQAIAHNEMPPSQYHLASQGVNIQCSRRPALRITHSSPSSNRNRRNPAPGQPARPLHRELADKRATVAQHIIHEAIDVILKQTRTVPCYPPLPRPAHPAVISAGIAVSIKPQAHAPIRHAPHPPRRIRGDDNWTYGLHS